MELDDVGVVEFFHNFDLTFRLLFVLLVLEEVGVDLLQGKVPSLFPDPEHLREAALADEFLHILPTAQTHVFLKLSLADIIKTSHMETIHTINTA